MSGFEKPGKGTGWGRDKQSGMGEVKSVWDCLIFTNV
jgi:hypothetical protein